MEVPYIEKGYPPARPPDTPREVIFRPRDFADVDNKARKTSAKLQGTVNELVDVLLKDLNSDLHKVRAIFTWLSAQPLLTMKFPVAVKPNTPEEWLKRIQQERSFYTDFFTLLCRAAEVPCVIIVGSSKGAGFEVGDEAPFKVTNRWNAVHVQGAWRLINVPWALSVTDGVEEGAWITVETAEGTPVRERVVSKKEVRQDLDEFWFLTNPEDFIALCLAKEKRWQLLANPWSEDDFRSIPKYAQEMFTSGWNLISAGSAVQKAEGGRCQIAFSHPIDAHSYSLTYNLYFNPKLSSKPMPDELNLDRYVVESSRRGRKDLLTKLPQDGIYKIEVAGVMDDEVIIPLAQFRIVCGNVGKQPPPFPEGFAQIGYTDITEQAGLVEPSHEDGFILAAEDEKVKMSFKLAPGRPRNRRIMAMMTHNDKKPEDLNKYVNVETTDENVNITAQVPRDKTNSDYGLTIGEQADQSGAEFEIIANYIITKDKNMTFPEQKAFIESKSNMLDAIKQEDVTRFQKSKNGLGSNIDPLTRERAHGFSTQINRIRADKLKTLLQAMSESDIDKLQKALTDYEGFEEVRQDVVKQAKAILELLRALKKEEEFPALEAALRHAYDVNVKDNSVLEKVEGRIITHYEKGLDDAYYGRALAPLREVLAVVDKSILAERIKQRKAYSVAKTLRDHLEEIKSLTDKVAKLSANEMKKIAGERNKRPADHVHSVLMATFVLLGMEESHLWEWEHIQNLLERRGELGVAKVMAALDVDRLTDQQTDVARGHVKYCQLEVVSNANPQAALFLRWVLAVVEEKRGRNAVKHLRTQISSSDSQ